MNDKLNNALANIDEELIYEAANAHTAGHGWVKAVLSAAAVAAVLGLAVGTRSIWHPVLFEESGGEVSLVDNTPTEGVDLLPAAQPSDGVSAPSELSERPQPSGFTILSEDEETGALPGVEAVEMTEEKIKEIYFGSNFPMLIYACSDIAVFSDGFDSSLYFYDIEQPELGGAMLYAIDLTETINSANASPDTGLPYGNMGYSYGGQTNGISAFAAEKDGAAGIFLSVSSYDDAGSAITLYRIVRHGNSNMIRKIASTTEGKSFPELLEGWEVIEAKTGGQYFEMADGRKVTTGLSGFDFADFTIEVTEGEKTCILHPFVFEAHNISAETADMSADIPDYTGEYVYTAVERLEEAGYECCCIYQQSDAPNGTVLGSELNDDGTVTIYVSYDDGFVLPLTEPGWYVYEPAQEDGGFSGHKGVDLAADFGAPICAAKEGTVVLSEYYYGYGNCVIIEHDNGLSTVYGHCSELFAEVGDRVSAGERIAAVGSTGEIGAAALHFEIRQDGEPVSHPMAYIRYYPDNAEEMSNLAE